MLQNWLFTQLQADSDDFIFQQDGTPSHWHHRVQAYLNENVAQQWIGRRGARDLAFCAWLARFLGVTVCDFFLWEYVKVYTPLLSVNINDMKNQIAN